MRYAYVLKVGNHIIGLLTQKGSFIFFPNSYRGIDFEDQDLIGTRSFFILYPNSLTLALSKQSRYVCTYSLLSLFNPAICEKDTC